jgi:Cytochrome P450
MQHRALPLAGMLAILLVLLIGHHTSSAFTTTVSPFVHHHHAAAGVHQQHQVLQKTSSGYTASQNSLLLLSTPSRLRAGGIVAASSPPPSSSSSSTHLSAAAVSSLVSALAKTSLITQAAVFLLTISVAVAIKKRRAYLFQTDPTVAAPLPDGKYGGCPLFGSNVISKSTKTGLAEFYSRASAAIGNPGVFKCLAFGQRMMVVSGAKLTKEVLSSEFASNGGVNTGTGLESSQVVTGKHSILYSQQEKEHNYLRRLIGQAMTPEAITRAIPTLEAVITKSLDTIVHKTTAAASSSEKTPTFVMENVCTDFTLDVAHSQILGLDLRDEEIIEFRQRVNDWIWGAFSPRVMFLPFTKQSKAYKARVYLVDKITRKIQQLRASGKDDGSTLSAMVFAKDEESQQRLTDIEIIDNALLLILAGK